MSVAVLVDTSSGITPDLARKFHVQLVPLHVLWDGKEYRDWIDMTPSQLYARMKTAKTWPTTSGSVQGQFYSAIQQLQGKVDGVVIVTLSPNTPSAGYSSALMAKDMTEDFPVEVVDSNGTATALGLVATAAAAAAARGGSLAEVVKAAQRIIPKMNLFLNPGSITYFLKGGRIVESEIGSKEESYIITVTKEGKLTPFEKFGTRAEARHRLRELVTERAKKGTPLHAAMFHAEAMREAEEFRKWIASEYDCAELWIGESAPVISIHVSPDSLGIAFYNE